jgi:PAS domain S-box-containing protein
MSLSIIVIEDFKPDVELIRHELAKNKISYTLRQVDNRHDFLEELKKETPDLVLSDFKLPQYDGLSAISDLKEKAPDIPIIICTGTLDEETAAETIKSGAWDYVVKERLYRLPTAIQHALKLKEEIAQKKKATKALHETEDAYETLRSNVPIALYRATVKGDLLYANPALLTMFGYPSLEEIQKIPMKDLYVDPENRNILMTQLMKEKVIKNFEVAFNRKDGTTFWGSVNAQAIFDEEGEHLFQDGIIVDITELKKTTEALIQAKEKAEESDHLKTAFLANMSHEIRTPLNAILGFSDLLNEPYYTKEEMERFVELIHKNGHSLLNIINDILDIAKIEAGVIQLFPESYPVENMVNELFESFSKPKFPESQDQIAFDLKTPQDPDLLITTDQNRLKQILTNLLSNAFKFTEEGSVTLSYQTDEDHITFVVSDTGMGIPEEQLDIIFNRFRQLDDSHTRERGGTGLGLTIAKNLVEKLHGSIWVESALYEGSSFYVRLPLHTEKAKTSKDQKKIKPVYSSVMHHDIRWPDKTILIVEDVASNYNYLDFLLKKTGAKILWAENGKDAIIQAEEHDAIDVILMDIQLPDLNGLEATREIKKMRPDLPIIAQTAFALSTDEQEVYDAGCDAYIPKPISKKTFFNILIPILGT